jgi:nicotinamide-nucleotide amidase
MNAEIISIGDELLIGQVINTNQAYIAERLNTVGIYTDRMTTVGDDQTSIIRAFSSALSSYDLLFVTGGLGPPHEDITRTAVCSFFNTGLRLDTESLQNVRSIFAKRNVSPGKINEDQALIPENCTPIRNRLGTAPGYFIEDKGKRIFIMPGVPFEMKAMVEEFVLPYLEKLVTNSIIRHVTLKTTGIAESFLADIIGNVRNIFPEGSGITLAFLPSQYGVRLRITVRAGSAESAGLKIREAEATIRSKIEQYIYATGDTEMEDVVALLLKKNKLTISTAESCTWGLIADRITNIPGSSGYFERGMITYSNDSKTGELGIPPGLIIQHGAVSREVAEAMASGIRKISGSDIGLSTTGIAGPSGGTSEKPVGLVWIGYSDKETTFALQFNFGGERRMIKERASQAALDIVRRNILRISD